MTAADNGPTRTDAEPRRLRDVAAVFAPLGWRAVGGPAVHVALMEREVVRRRKWMSSALFARLFAACNLLPGPGSTQLALLIGLRRAGVAGMLLTALLFIGPAVLVMLALGELYAHFGAGHNVQLGLDAAVVAIVARAAVDLALISRRRLMLVLVAPLALAAGVLNVNPLLVLAGGAAVGAVFAAAQRPGMPAALAVLMPMLVRRQSTVVAAVTGSSALLPLALTFLKIGAVAFGSGYVLLPFLHNDFTGPTFHLTDRVVADAFAASQITPGPVFAVAAFLGVQVAGLPGGAVAAVAVFLPSLVFVPLVSVVMRVTDANPWLRAMLEGVFAAAIGLIASSCVVLGRATVVGPVEAITAVAVFLLLWRFPRAQPVGILLGAAGGIVVMLTS